MTSRNERARKIVKQATIALGLLAAYFIVGSLSGLWLFCPLHRFTGLLCPGCGVTTMCRALLRSDIRMAWQSNALLLVCLPFLFAIWAFQSIRYIQTGSRKAIPIEKALTWLMVAAFLLFGILRNLPMLRVVL